MRLIKGVTYLFYVVSALGLQMPDPPPPSWRSRSLRWKNEIRVKPGIAEIDLPE